MSLKRRAKLQHSTSPKSSIQKQINNDLSMNAHIHPNNQNSTQYYLLQKMQQKISKILNAYQKIQDQSKRKDDVIKQLQKQNQLLKERLVQKSHDLKHSRFQTHLKKQPAEGHIIQRTFTPLDIKKQPKIANQQSYKSIQSNIPTFSVVRQYDTQNHLNKLLKQSKSLDNLNKTYAQYKPKFQSNNVSNLHVYQPNEQQNKIFSRRDQNRAYHQGFEQDKSFMDVLGKLKQKIKKFDQQDVENSKKIGQKQQYNVGDINSLRLSKVKSSHNITRRPYNFNEKKQKQQTQALKQIWNQRDEQIKRMDELFSRIDQRINVIQNQQ